MAHSVYYYGNFKKKCKSFRNDLGRNEILSIVFCNLNRTNEKLAETSTKLLVEKQQKKSLINPITMSPVLELPSVRNMNNSSLFNRYVAPRESLVIPTSSSWPTKNGIETFLTKVDDLRAKLETASSKCLYLDANNQLLTQELTSMKEMQKKYEKLEKDKKKLEQQVVNLRSQVEFSMVEYSKTEQYKWELEERTRLDITEKLKEANLFFEVNLLICSML